MKYIKYLESFQEMIRLRGLTDGTLRSYTTYLTTYLKYLENILGKDPEEVTWKDLREYIKWLEDTRHLSGRTINSIIAQLKFFVMYVLHKQWEPTQLPMRKVDVYLPYVPSKGETIKFINSITNLRLKAIVALMYSSGMRIGEVCNLKVSDIDSENMRIHIRTSKNRNGRYAILSQNTLELLRAYWRKYRGIEDYLFPRKNNIHLPERTGTITNMIHEHEDSLGLERKFTCHTFRHAFGTHLYESGADLLEIKTLLGHKSINSTVIYVHLANKTLKHVISPFDSADGEFNVTY